MKPLSEHKNVMAALRSALRETLDFVGETDAPELVFLSLYTRFLPNPVALVLKAPPANSKSYSKDCGLAFIPPDAYKSVTGLSPKALVHMQQDALKHKFLVVGEFAGIDKRDGLDQLRQLLTEGKIAYEYATAGGNQTGTLDGPIGLLMTTTKQDLHVEDESRVLSFHMKASDKTKREVLIRQAKGVKDKTLPPADAQRWHELHQFVEKNLRPVRIPYAENVADKLPIKHARIMRDWPKVLSLIKAHALLHQSNRKAINGEVVATAADYEAVRALVEPALSRGIHNALPALARQIIQAVQEMQAEGNGQASKKGEPGCSVVQIAARLGVVKSVVSRGLDYPLELGYLRDSSRAGDVDSKKDRARITKQLVLGDTPLGVVKVLPEWREIAA